MQYRKIIILILLFFSLFGTYPVLALSLPQALTVDKAVEIAMENNLNRKMARGNVQIAQDRVAQALAAFGPNLGLEGGLYRYNEEPSLVQLNQGLVRLNNALSRMTSGGVPTKAMPSDSLTYYGFGVKITQPLYTGNRLTSTRDMALANRENTSMSLTTVENDLVLAVKKAYFTVVLTRQMVLAMDDAVGSMERHVKEAFEYHRMNIVPKLDLLRAREKLADLKQQQLYAKNKFTLAKTTLNYVLGVDLTTTYAFDTMPSGTSFPFELGACEEKALAQRPELSAMDAKIKMAKEQVTLAQSGRLPTIALTGAYRKYAPENDAPEAEIGIVARINLYDHGMVSHRVAQARHELENAQIAKKQLARGIRLEVEQAFRNAETALESITVAEKTLDTAQETLEAARTRYRVGLSTSLERLDAEIALTRARTNHISALSMYHIAVSELERAVGKE